MQPFLGQIQTFGFSFNPRGWAKCDGQLLAISQNDALFSLLGTIYGGDGRTTFGLPDLRGRAMVHEGTGPGLSPRRLGAKGGTYQNTLNANQLPSHKHTLNVPVSDAAPAVTNASGAYLTNQGSDTYAQSSAQGSQLGANITTASTGSNMAVPNIQPSLTINICIATVGIYPSRT